MAPRNEQDLARIVGRRIRELRDQHGWGQVDLAAHVDDYVKQAAISYFETGRRLPSLRTLFRLAGAFDVEPAALLLNPRDHERHRIALAVLECSEEAVGRIGKIVDATR